MAERPVLLHPLSFIAAANPHLPQHVSVPLRLGNSARQNLVYRGAWAHRITPAEISALISLVSYDAQTIRLANGAFISAVAGAHPELVESIGAGLVRAFTEERNSWEEAIIPAPVNRVSPKPQKDVWVPTRESWASYSLQSLQQAALSSPNEMAKGLEAAQSVVQRRIRSSGLGALLAAENLVVETAPVPLTLKPIGLDGHVVLEANAGIHRLLLCPVENFSPTLRGKSPSNMWSGFTRTGFLNREIVALRVKFSDSGRPAKIDYRHEEGTSLAGNYRLHEKWSWVARKSPAS